jgi:hypothetical protein
LLLTAGVLWYGQPTTCRVFPSAASTVLSDAKRDTITITISVVMPRDGLQGVV